MGPQADGGQHAELTTGSRSKLRWAKRRQRQSEPASANIHAAWDPLRAAAGPTVVRPVGGGWPTAKIGFVDVKRSPSTFPADRRGDQRLVGSPLVTTSFSLGPRVAQNSTDRLAAET
jgi:hypothetical protein